MTFQHLPRPGAVAATILACALSLTACGSQETTGTTGGDTSSSSPSQSASPSASTSASASTSPTKSPSGSPGSQGPGAPTDTSPKSGKGSGGGDIAQVTGIRTGRHATYDRVVIDLSRKSPVPKYRVAWVPGDQQLREPGSGKAVQIQGNRVLKVTLRYTRDRTQRDLKPGLPAVREVRDLGSFEAETVMGIGVQTTHGTAKKVGFRVTPLTQGRPRLVIDVAHADASLG